ncbi:MAG: helix-turn-helix domain-containing protein [Pseudomonadota bacterium]
MTRPAETPRLMGTSDAARYLGVSPTYLRALDIPRKVLGTRRLYERSDLDAFADTLRYEDEADAEAACAEVFGCGG